MAVLVAFFMASVDTPLTSPGTVPTIRIRRTDTQALVITDANMTETGDGNYHYDFTPVVGLEYTIRADGDPAAASQTMSGGRYAFGELSELFDRDITTDYTTAQRATTAGGALRYMRMMATNRIEEDSDAQPTNGELVLYEDDASTVALTYDLTDEGGESLTTTKGEPARRTAGS